MSVKQTDQFDFDFNFQGSSSNNDKQRNGRRYDDDDDEDDHPRGGSTSHQPSKFDFDNFTGDKGKEHKYQGDSSCGSKFDFNDYESKFNNTGSSLSGPSYSDGGGKYSSKYDKNVTAIGSSGEMVGPNGYVPGAR